MANISSWFTIQLVGSLDIKNEAVTIRRVPKRYEYAVTERLAGYLFRTGAYNIVSKISFQSIRLAKVCKKNSTFLFRIICQTQQVTRSACNFRTIRSRTQASLEHQRDFFFPLSPSHISRPTSTSWIACL